MDEPLVQSASPVRHFAAQNAMSNGLKKVSWGNLIFFSATTLLGVAGVPFYLYRFGLSLPEFLLFAFYMAAVPLSITLGYHRLFAHATFKASAPVRFCVLFFGAGAFEQPALKWASQHRDHHRYVDTDLDPYSIKKGFFYAHIGWLIFWKHKINYENVKDLWASRLIRHQYKYYYIWAVTSGIILPLLIGALTGHVLGALLLSVCLRLTLVYHATFCINSVCHMFGKATYDIYSSARDHWVAALITYGEGYHNFHHHFPADYRNGVRWYQWDPTKWLIALLANVGLAWNLKKVSRFQILAARLAAENQRAQDWLTRIQNHPHLTTIHKALQCQYEKLRLALTEWERAAREHQNLIHRHIAERSDALREAASRKMRDARNQFQETLARWQSFRLQLFTAA